MNKLITLDLFAGAGGLSYGFLKTGFFNIKIAVENNKYARETYKENHPDVELVGDIKNINFNEFLNRYGNIDVIIGGPPCQGFSNANRQRNYLVSPKNQLVKKYIEAVEIINPSILVFENVKTITSEKHKFFYSYDDKEIINNLNLNLREEIVDLGACCIDPCKFLKFLNNYKFKPNIKSYLIPENIYTSLNQLLKNMKNISLFNKYYKKHKFKINKIVTTWNLNSHKFWCKEYKKICINIKNLLILNNGKKIFNYLSTNLFTIVETQKIINKIIDIQQYNIYTKKLKLSDTNHILLHTKSYKIVEFIEKKLISLGYSIDSKVLNAAAYCVPQLRERFILIGIKKELAKKTVTLPVPIIESPNNYYTIGDYIKDLEPYTPSVNLSDYKPIERKSLPIKKNKFLLGLCDSRYIYNHIITNTRDTALERFKNLQPGQNFHDLTDNLKTTYTDPSKTQNTIYKRLRYDVPSDTVVNVRKSMWIHPTKNRAISIREAARLQSFPDSFVFFGTKDAQYQQIGNAVPPLLGQAIANKIIDIIT